MFRIALAALLPAAIAFAAMPQLHLRDTQGAIHTNTEWSGDKAVLLFFVTTDCPVANSYVPEMNRIREAYASRGVAVYAVQAETTVPDAAVAAYAKEFHYAFPLLLDPHQQLVDLTGASIVSQAVVMTPEGQVLYRGRIDNRVEDFGKQRPSATESELREALDAVLAGKPVPHPFTKTIGCAINHVK